MPLEAAAVDRLVALRDELEQKAREEIAKERADTATIDLDWGVRLHYQSQSAIIEVALPPGRDDCARLLGDALAASYLDEFGYRLDEPIVVAGLHLRAFSRHGAAELGEPRDAARSNGGGAPVTRAAYFGDRARGAVTCDVLRRSDFRSARPGPCLVDEPDCTIVIPPGWTATLDRAGSVVIRDSVDSTVQMGPS
jgi:N-methylhydantoinase A